MRMLPNDPIFSELSKGAPTTLALSLASTWIRMRKDNFGEVSSRILPALSRNNSQHSNASCNQRGRILTQRSFAPLGMWERIRPSSFRSGFTTPNPWWILPYSSHSRQFSPSSRTQWELGTTLTSSTKLSQIKQRTRGKWIYSTRILHALCYFVAKTRTRGIYVNSVFRPTAAIIEEVYQLWSSTTNSIKDVPGIAYFLIFQRMPAIRPGNALGLEGSDEPMVLCLLSVTWTRHRMMPWSTASRRLWSTESIKLQRQPDSSTGSSISITLQCFRM